MSDALMDRIRDANPVPHEPLGPPIDAVWRRVEQVNIGQRTVASRRAGLEWAGRGAVLVSVLVALAVGGAAVLVLRNDRRPVQSTVAGAPAGASAEEAAIDVLGALRRPRTKADLPPSLVRGLRDISPLVGSPILALVRLATVAPWGPRLYLVPLRRPTDRQIEQWAARTAGPRNRAAVASNMIARVAQLPAFEGVGVYPGAVSPASATQILSGQAWVTGGRRVGNLLVNEVTGIVPDGVSRVSLTLASRGDAHPAVLSAVVHNNVVAFTAPEAIENLAADRITWYSSTGAIIKPLPPTHSSHRLTPPGASEGAAGHVPPGLVAHYAVLRGSVARRPPNWLRTRLREMTGAFPETGQLEMTQIREIPLAGSSSLWVIPATSGLCIADETPSAAAPNHPSVGTHCESTRAALSQGVLALEQQAPGDPYRLSGVVPDGNSSVIAHFHSGATLTLPVTNNGIDAYLPNKPSSVSFLNAAGHGARVPFG